MNKGDDDEMIRMLESFRSTLTDLDLGPLPAETSPRPAEAAPEAGRVAASPKSDEFERALSETIRRRMDEILPHPRRRPGWTWHLAAAALLVGAGACYVLWYRAPLPPPAEPAASKRPAAPAAAKRPAPPPAVEKPAAPPAAEKPAAAKPPAPKKPPPAPKRPYGLGAVGGAFLWIDAKAKELVVFDPSSAKFRQTFPFPNRSASGIAAGKDVLWSASASRGKIYRHDPKTYKIVETHSSPGERPMALHWDGKNLWSVDLATRKVYRHAAGKGLPVVASAPVAAKLPVGLSRVGKHLWVLDGRTLTVYRYDISRGLAYAGKARLRGRLPSGMSAHGMAVHKDRVWLQAGGPMPYRLSVGKVAFSK